MAKNKNFFKILKQYISSLFFPRNFTCDFCGDEINSEKYHICKNCQNTLPFNNENICKKCGSEIESGYDYCLNCKDKQLFYKYARAPFIYKGKIKQIIHKFKYQNARYLAQSLGNFMTDTIILNNFDFDLIIPVPLHPKREKSRGYNQSKLLSEQVSNNLHIPVLTDCLIREKFTISQTSLLSSQRYKNLEDNFNIVDKTKIAGKRILLIDDVMTTGATVEACSKLLIDNGSNIVYVCSACRTSSKFDKNE